MAKNNNKKKSKAKNTEADALAKSLVAERERVFIKGIASRPELNGRVGRIVSLDLAAGRAGVEVQGEGKPLSLKWDCLTVERDWRKNYPNCRHGGPAPAPELMGALTQFMSDPLYISGAMPSVGQLVGLEPLVRAFEDRGGAASAAAGLFTAMGTDAWLAGDVKPIRSFAAAALLFDAVASVGSDVLFAELRRDVQHTKQRERLKARATSGKCAVCLRSDAQLGDAVASSAGTRDCAACGAKRAAHGCPCKLVRYCSRECQLQAWSAHKEVCKRARKAGRDIVVKLPCGHSLHKKCLTKVNQDPELGLICPFCRRPLVPVLQNLEAKLEKCKSASGLRDVFQAHTSCSCVAIGAAFGEGVADSQLQPSASELTDPLFAEDARYHPDLPLPHSARAVELGLGLGATVFEELRQQGGPKEGAAARLREACEAAASGALGAEPDLQGRGGAREKQCARCHADAAAGCAFLSRGGAARLKQAFRRGLDVLKRDPEGAPDPELLLAFEVPASMSGAALGRELVRNGSMVTLCETIAKGRSAAVTHNAIRALVGVMSGAQPEAWASEPMVVGALKDVVTELGCWLEDVLRDDFLDFKCLDVVVAAATFIALGGADLARLVGGGGGGGGHRGHVIPISLCLIVVHHAHEHRAGRLESAEHHLTPISMALEALYAISLHFDLRAVRIGADESKDQSLQSALREYSGYLTSFFDMCSNPKAVKYLARLVNLKAEPQLDVELTVQQSLRLAERYAEKVAAEREGR